MDAHACALADVAARELAGLRHTSGRPAVTARASHATARLRLPRRTSHRMMTLTRQCTYARTTGINAPNLTGKQVYGRGDRDASVAGWGPTVAFNVFDSHGRLVGYREVERMCGLRGVCLRGGSFCNPGGAARAFGLTADMVKEAHKARRRAVFLPHAARILFFPCMGFRKGKMCARCEAKLAHHRCPALSGPAQAGRICGDGGVHPNGRPLGAVRASFGLSSSLSARIHHTPSCTQHNRNRIFF